jgi:hypothetical protein
VPSRRSAREEIAGEALLQPNQREGVSPGHSPAGQGRERGTLRCGGERVRLPALKFQGNREEGAHPWKKKKKGCWGGDGAESVGQWNFKSGALGQGAGQREEEFFCAPRRPSK